MVSFSHDPCERPLNLITQMPGSRNGNGVKPNNTAVNDGSSGYAYPSNDLVRSMPHSPRRVQGPIVDAEGWQTVGKRR
jgi:hypothetical protein